MLWNQAAEIDHIKKLMVVLSKNTALCLLVGSF